MSGVCGNCGDMLECERCRGYSPSRSNDLLNQSLLKILVYGSWAAVNNFYQVPKQHEVLTRFETDAVDAYKNDQIFKSHVDKMAVLIKNAIDDSKV